jgi:hypothetical protein
VRAERGRPALEKALLPRHGRGRLVAPELIVEAVVLGCKGKRAAAAAAA